MSEAQGRFREVVQEQVPPQAPLPRDQPIRVSSFDRDLRQNNLVLSGDDLKGFCQLLADVNERRNILCKDNCNPDFNRHPVTTWHRDWMQRTHDG